MKDFSIRAQAEVAEILDETSFLQQGPTLIESTAVIWLGDCKISTRDTLIDWIRLSGWLANSALDKERSRADVQTAN